MVTEKGIVSPVMVTIDGQKRGTMPEQKCRVCGAMVESEDYGRPCDTYYCDCGKSWIDLDGYADRKAMQADDLRKQAKEGGI